MQNNPLKIYNYVHDHIRHVLYFGSKKGSELTLLEKSGNDFDQCALLVALLHAAGYSDAGYQFGWMLLPYDSSDGSNRDIHHWLDLDLTNSNWSTTANFLDYVFETERGYPITAHNFGNNIYAFQRVWVTVTVGGTNYSLDPSFKVTERIAGIDVPTAMGFSISGLTNAAAGVHVGSNSSLFYTANLNETAVRGTLTGYTTNLLNCIQSNYPNASVEQIIGGRYIVPSTNSSLGQCLLFAPTNLNGTMPVTNWVYEPTNMMSTLAISFLNQTFRCPMPSLLGARLSLDVTNCNCYGYPATYPTLWLDDSPVLHGTNINYPNYSDTFNVTITAYHPGFQSNWNTNSNTFIPGPGGQSWETTTKGYNNNVATYAILYAFEPDWGWIRARENVLDSYLAQGLSMSSREVVSETLNIMGLNWQMQCASAERILAQKIGVMPMFYHRIGRMSQESGYGYYVDIYMAVTGATSSSNQNDNHQVRWIDECSYFDSALEHGLIEQMQSANLVGASTVKMLDLGNANGQSTYLANSANWSVTQTNLTGYSAGSLSTIGGYVSGGNSVLLPKNGSIAINGSGSWTGYGIVSRNPNGGMAMLIGDSSGVHSGGYVSDPTATVNTSWVNYSAYSQPTYFSSAPMSLPSITGADPVNMVDGTFQVQSTDISLGQIEPRGLNFSRYYNSSRRNSNLVGMGYGWLHNYYLNAASVSSPQAGLGETTAAHMASMMVAITALNQVYNGDQPDPGNWLTTALIAKWGIDQLIARAVTVTLGNDSVQFIQQPDGSFTPPANSTMTLVRTNSAYWLKERHGRTYKFNASGWGTNIVDQYKNSLSLAYNSSNWVTTVTDWKGRSLNFNYSGTSLNCLTSVIDSTGRGVGLGYGSGGDLNSVTDPESKTSTFSYDSYHQITGSFDALQHMVVSNSYNGYLNNFPWSFPQIECYIGFGRVRTQLTQGDANKAWQIFWSGWQTVSQDPAGGQQSYIYDDKSRLIQQRDALGNLSCKVYDGQDHVVMTVSPLGETNQFVYDGSNNLIQMIDPLGSTNQFLYDNQNNLIRAVDPIGNTSTFGYNSQFSQIGRTNGAGDFVNYAYNTDGTVNTCTGSGGTTTFGYDSFGQVNSITYPSGLGGVSFVNNPLGDMTSCTDGKGNVTTFSYNNRRQLTYSVAPTNLVSAIAYDAVGNAVSEIDPRGNSVSKSWSPTRHLLALTFPATAKGTLVVSNIYDSRDWLACALDPAQQPTFYTNDLAGRLISVTDPLNRTTTFNYDANGNRLACTNAAQEVTRQSWDARGKLIQLTDGAGHVSTRAYDAAGNQTILTNRNGKKWQFKFDGANRLTNTITPLGRSASLVYNHQGLVASAKDSASQQTSLNYDAKARVISRTDNVGTTYYGYDVNDNLNNVVENSLTNSWTFDAYNHISSYKDVFGNLIQYRYDASGNLTNLVYPGGKNVYYGYDNLNRLLNVTDWSRRRTSINYDSAGRLSSIIRPNGSLRTFSYNAAGEMTDIREQLANNLPMAWFKFHSTNSGNMAWEFAAPLPHSVTVPTRTMTYDDDNRLATVNGSSVTSDLDGNLTYAPLTNGAFATQTFDARNRLLAVGGTSSATNIYDAMNSRVGQIYGTNITAFVVNPNAKLPQVLMRIKNGVTNYYIYGGGLLYQITETATVTNTLTYHFDCRGSTFALSDDNDSVTDWIEYSAYGLSAYRTGTNDTPFLFNGRYGVMTDPNGLLDMRARYYNPYLCRFLSADPSGFGGGLNHYVYANGNPVSLVDPFGLGALQSSVDLSWFNAPTVEQQQCQELLGGFANFATLGAANLVTSAIGGTDMAGNQMAVGDALQQSMESVAFVATLALALPTGGASLEANTVLEEGTQITVGEGDVLSRVWDSRWTQGSRAYSGPFGGSYSPNAAMPINAQIGRIDRGLNIPGVVNNSQAGGLYQATQTFPAVFRTSIQGVEPEIVVEEQYRQYLRLLQESVSTIPTGR